MVGDILEFCLGMVPGDEGQKYQMQDHIILPKRMHIQADPVLFIPSALNESIMVSLLYSRLYQLNK